MKDHEFIGLAGTKFTYCEHPYNAARTNERAVEVPMAVTWIGTRKGLGLEVGNVLTNYCPGKNWRCVDAYEGRDAGVIAVDIMDYDPPEKFDWIVTISTVEHIGWDASMPAELDSAKALKAIDHMRGLLSPGGQLFVSFPTGVHPELDRAAADGSLNPIDSVFMLRTDGPTERTDGIWEARPFEPAPYLVEAWSAGGVWVGILSNTMPA